ncbi:MAG: tetratricopeptide repeat protein [Chloroflexi bacterium]|nr:tetratricopeptide repeat protein [Chloroflexota bacterium]
MARLQLSLLGALQIALDGQQVSGFESGKVRALLAYLALHANRAQNRDALVGLLWPEQPEEAARANLRQALANLRRAISDANADPPFLLVSRDAVQFNPAGDSWVDVGAFTALMDACDRHVHRRIEACTSCAHRLTQAVELYRGPFLDGLFVQESVAFEEWLILQREALHRRALQALFQLAAYHERRGAYDEAYHYASQQLELEPWREEAHRQVMRVLVLQGERTAALAQYDTCRRLLLAGLSVEPSEATTALYERIREAEGDAPLAREELALPSARPHNLPPQPTPFIGRERELAELAELIERPECRLITLVGQGGSGKTRMALQAAAEQIGAFSDGVYFVPLAPVESSQFLVSTIGTAMGFSFSVQRDARTQLLNELSDKELLLVLDNFEHLMDATDLIIAILQQAAGVTILATARERLNLQGEWAVAVEGLPYPDLESVDSLENYAALQLFVQSARRTESSFALNSQVRLAVLRICRLVGGLPLAIELAAGWVSVLSANEIAQEIENNLDFLATQLKDVPARHRNMRAVFDRSWSLLSEQERDLFVRLSVFRGGFQREASERGGGASLHLLSSLVSKSFLHRIPRGRYEIHELLRQYAYDKLQALSNSIEAHDTHAGYYATFVRKREDRLRGHDQLNAIAEIGDEIDNVREAWHWAVEHMHVAEIDAFSEGLWFFYEIRGLAQEGFEAFGRAVTAVSSDLTADEALDRLDREEALALGKVLARRAAFGTRLGRNTEGRDMLEQSIKLLQRFGARREVAFALNMLGMVARLQSEYAQARAFLQESLVLFREVGDRWGIAYSLSDLGNVAYLLGEFEEAMRLHEESLNISRQAGDCRAMIFCLSDMSSVAISLGKYGAAERFCQEVLSLSQQIGHRWGRAISLYQLGSIALYSGNFTQGKTFLEESLRAFREMGDLQHASIPLERLGYLAYLQGDHVLAQHLLQEALALCDDTGYQRGRASTLNTLGMIIVSVSGVAEIKQAEGNVEAPAWALGEAQKAQQYLQEALADALEIQAWSLVLDILVSMVVARATDLPPEEAYEILSLVREHPSSDKQTKDRAERALSALEGVAGNNRNASARTREDSRTLEQMVSRMVRPAQEA